MGTFSERVEDLGWAWAARMREFSERIKDFRWAMNAMRARRFRRKMGFAERLAFDEALRPRHKDGAIMAYPDALYHITVDDVVRAAFRGTLYPLTNDRQAPSPQPPKQRR